MKAKTGVKKRFNIINEKKSIIINALKSAFFLLEIIRDDKKLKHKKIIKNWLVNNWDSKTLKFKISNNDGASSSIYDFGEHHKNSILFSVSIM